MNNKKIGIFDSGIGGLTVVKSIKETLSNESIVYFGDTLNMPYGDKSNEEIIKLVKNDVAFLSAFDLKAIVIACNTADSIASKSIKEDINVPIFGVVEPASKKACSLTKNSIVGVIATKATVSSNAYVNAIQQINPDITVLQVACPELVPLVEQGKFKESDIETIDILKEYLTPLMYGNIDTLILGCTHYPLLKDLINMLMPNVNIISSSDCAAEYVKNELEKLNLLSNEKSIDNYYVSSEINRFISVSKLFMDISEENVHLK